MDCSLCLAYYHRSWVIRSLFTNQVSPCTCFRDEYWLIANVVSSDHLLPSSPVPHLSRSISSLLCSTLLQPSAIILAMWYISRLPISSISPEVDSVARMNELLFQQELFGHRYSQFFAGDKQAEYEVPFRLVLLGCMLANKWLDDHTFSNRTW